jgi:ribosomal protein L11 methyltransferase
MTVYLEARFLTGKDAMASDILTALLAEIGFESFTEEAGVFSGYIQEHLFDQAQLDDVINLIPGVSLSALVKHEPENWNALWESQFEPIRINEQCWIRAPFHNEIPGARLQLVIEPKMSFGTGHHATTRLMCSLMLHIDFTAKQVWDYGCGTGVLGILAGKMGASNVFANDIETWAVENAMENAQRNSTQMNLFTGGADLLPSGKTFDIILANINRNILIETADQYLPTLHAEGFLLVSGFLNQDEDAIVSFYTTSRLKLISTMRENGWSSLLFQKK